ncbi:MAG TPA: PAS domain S-box protein [Longimicrobiales bacterium]|nr:PAS domain S-box protein [Longimicrobiales bacterium]
MTSASGRPGDDRRNHPLRRADDLFRLLVDNVRDYAIFLLDTEGHIASWNRGAERIKGYTESEVLGRHYSLFYPSDAVRELDPDRQLEIAAAEGRFETEGWRVRKDGRRFWAHVVIVPVRDEDGTLVGFGTVTGEMTAERNAREALKRRTRQLTEAQQIAHVGSWEWDVNADRLTWSDELYRIFGVEIGTPMDLDAYAEMLHPDDRDRVLARVRESLETGEPYTFEHRLVRSDGEERTVQSRGEAVRDDDGRVVRLVGTALDITEFKRSQERERKLTGERLLRAEAERTARRMRFLAEASQLLGTSLEYEETLRTVARLAVPDFADWCAVDILGRDGRLDRLAVAHVDPKKVELAHTLHERYPPRADDPAQALYRVLRSGVAEIIAEITPDVLEAAATDREHARMLRELGLRSAILAPIHVREHALGVITFINAESGRAYEEDDLVVAQELAGRAGLAIENSQLHLAERQARRHAERAGDRMARLQAITAGLSEAVSPAAVAEVIVEQGVAALGAAHGSLVLRDGETLEIVRSVGLPKDVARTFRTMSLDADVPIAEAVRTGEMILLGTRAERDARFPNLREVRERMGSGAVAAVPLRSAGEMIGGLAFGYEEERPFTEEERDFLSSLARQCVQALERAWLYETEHEARQAAEAASQAKSQFLAMMSHELRTPLSAIIGYQELLSEGIVGPVSERQKEQLRRIRVSATHLRDLINQILSLSRIEAGKEEVARDEVDLAELTQDVVVLLEQEAEAKGLDVRVDLPAEPVEITSDAGKIRQILLNLLTNAIKFTDEGSVRIEVGVTPDEVSVTVADTGIGISPQHRDRIFEAFTQVDQSMTRRAGGSGLGLPVSQRLARLLGGRIDLESDVDEGSRFTLRLPK